MSVQVTIADWIVPVIRETHRQLAQLAETCKLVGNQTRALLAVLVAPTS